MYFMTAFVILYIETKYNIYLNVIPIAKCGFDRLGEIKFFVKENNNFF